MSTLSLCLIVKNEEKILERALNSIYKLADEIIIVDTGSTDKTVEIAKKFTDKVYHFKWIDDFGAAYAFSHSFATCDYTSRWDADFELIEGFEYLLELKNRDFDGADIVNLKWNIEFDEDGKATRYHMRDIIHKRGVFHWESPIHAHIVPNDPSYTPIIKNYPEIVVDHLKDPVDKAWRYAQTKDILESTLKDDPNNLRLSMYYANSLIFDKEYEKAAQVLEKNLKLLKNNESNHKSGLEFDSELGSHAGTVCLTVEQLCLCYINLKTPEKAKELCHIYQGELSNNPQFILIWADVESVFDLEIGKKLYERFLGMELSAEFKQADFSKDRYIAHPNSILGQIYFKNKQYKLADKHLKIALENCTDLKSLPKLKTLKFLTRFLKWLG